LENPYQDRNSNNSSSLQERVQSPIVQSSPDPFTLGSRSSSHSHQLFQSASQLPSPLTQLPSSEPQPSTSRFPQPRPVQMDTDNKQATTRQFNCCSRCNKCKRRSGLGTVEPAVVPQLQNAPAAPAKGPRPCLSKKRFKVPYLTYSMEKREGGNLSSSMHSSSKVTPRTSGLAGKDHLCPLTYERRHGSRMAGVKNGRSRSGKDESRTRAFCRLANFCAQSSRSFWRP